MSFDNIFDYLRIKLVCLTIMQMKKPVGDDTITKWIKLSKLRSNTHCL